jgi:hypothetical protein
MNAYLVSHNGLGDNLFMVGALNYLLKFYNKVYYLCKNKYFSNVELFFIDNKNIICLPFDEKNEFKEIYKIIMEKYFDDENDIFISGPCHKSYLKSKINNKLFLENIILDKKYTIEFDTIGKGNYGFIENFYKDINLNLTIFYDYFKLPYLNESVELYNSVSEYNIIFIQLKSSCGKCLNITNLLNKYLNDKNTILICNDINLYDNNSESEDIKKKHNLCEKFVFNKIVYLVDTIKNSSEIYIIDSCLSGLLLQFINKNQLKAKIIRIILRNLVENIFI